MDNRKIIYITSLIVILNTQINFLYEEKYRNEDSMQLNNLEEFVGDIRIIDSSSDSTSSINISIRLIPSF